MERRTGSYDVHRELVAITDTRIGVDSPYADRARQGATVVPRCLFFTTRRKAPPPFTQADHQRHLQTGSQDKKPWKDLTLLPSKNAT